jgi:hypothetical protein
VAVVVGAPRRSMELTPLRRNHLRVSRIPSFLLLPWSLWW